jgi:cytochrome c peroxidase
MNSRNLSLLAGATLAIALFSPVTFADSKDEETIKEVMKKYHKAPQGQDHIAKKASMGKASPEEMKDLVAAYTKMAATHPPKGDEASWKEKNTKLVAAAKALQKGDANGVELFKDASNCKACHSVHRPEKN